MSRRRILVKLGGASLSHPQTLSALVELLLYARTSGLEIIVVHGGGPAINAELTRRGISWSFINGQRQTTKAMVGVIEEVLAETVNTEIAGYLSQAQLPVQRFSGAKDKILRCEREVPELMQVGKVVAVSAAAIETALAHKQIPVIAPVGYGIDELQNVEIFNINADWAAAQLAAHLKVDSLLFLTDQYGILGATQELLHQVDHDALNSLIEEGVISGGMMTKVRAMLFAQQNGVGLVKIGKAIEGMRLLRDSSCGTTLINKINGLKQEMAHGASL